MRGFRNVLTISVVALIAVSMSAVQPAKAGDGGEDFGTLQSFIGAADGSTGLCQIVGMNPCPQLPTLIQAVLQYAGLTNAPAEMVRSTFFVPEGNHVDAANLSRPPATNPIRGFPVASNVLST